MVNFSQQTTRYRAGYLLGIVFSVLSASTTLLAPISGQAATSPQLCSGQVCISATIFSKEPNTIEFSLVSKLAVGWLGLGMGGQAHAMTGNDLAICWPTATGKGAIISQRAASQNGQPSVKTTTVPFQVQTNKSMLSTTKLFTCTYSRPLNLTTSPIAATATAINVIFAVGLQAVQGTDPQTAVLQQHTFTGTGSLTIVRTDGSSSGSGGVKGPAPTTPGGGSTGNNTGGTTDPDGDSQASLDEILARAALYSKLVKAHGLLMSIAFLVLFPTGAFIVRFFSHRQEIFRFHRPIQVFGFLTVLSAFICILVAVSKNPNNDNGQVPSVTSSTHASVGLFLVCALVLQILIGVFIFHAFNPSRDARTKVAKAHLVSTWGHRAWGYLILLTGFTQVSLGLSRYGQWPLGTESIWYCFYAWVAVVIAVFFLGSAFKMWRTRLIAQTGNTGGGGTAKGEWESEGREGALKVNHDPYHTQPQRKQSRSGRRAALEDDQYELQAHSRQSTGGDDREEHRR